MPDRYFQLLDTIGLHHETGEPEPINNVGVGVTVPVMRDGEVVDEAQRVTILPAPSLGAADVVQARILPGSRTLEIRDPRIAAAILSCGQYEEVDPPAGLSTLLKSDLEARADELGIEHRGLTKARIAEAIEAHEKAEAEAVAGGDADGADEAPQPEQDPNTATGEEA